MGAKIQTGSAVAGAGRDADVEQLRELGYTPQFERSMSKWENFALGFTYLSPVVGVYTIFGMAIVTGGPPMWWTYLLVGIGQLLVSLVFGEIVSQFPIAGGLYPWARRLVGKRWAWMAGWFYGWALCITLAAVSTGAAPFVSQLFNLNAGPGILTTIAIAMLVASTLLNLSGTRWLARVAMFGFVCELIGALAVGGYLLLFSRHQSFSTLLDTTVVSPSGNYWPAFLASSLAAMFCYYGFEACGDVAEETPDASRMIPKAMRLTVYVGGAAAMWVCLALILAIPDLHQLMTTKDADPVATILTAALGVGGFKAVICVVLVSFVSCLLSLQAAASRLIFAYARDQMMIGSLLLQRISTTRHVPVTALLASGVVPAVIAIAAFWLQNAVATIISFAAVGIYIGFQMITIAALYGRLKGWRPGGAFTLGRLGWLVNILAIAYGLSAIVNMAWPRTPDAPWFTNYGVIVTTAGLLLLGLAYMVFLKPYESSNAPAGDAWHKSTELSAVPNAK